MTAGRPKDADYTTAFGSGNIAVMTSQLDRAEFPPGVVRTVAQRAAYRCTFPNCDQMTIGPSANESHSVITGVAAHIYSARDGGPRGSGGLTSEQRQSIENAIWLCANHAGRIDKNNGVEFPASMLKDYKRIHEQKIIRERDGIGPAVGWIHTLSIDQAPVFRTPAVIEFGKITVIVGDNDSGKTALCDWVQGLSDPTTVCKWVDEERQRKLSFELTYLDPVRRTVRVRAQSRDEVEYFVDGEPVPFNPSPIKFVRLRDLRLSRFSDKLPPMSDLDFLSKTLSVNPALLRNMLPLVGTQKGSRVTNLRLEADETGSIRVWPEVRGTVPGLSLQRQLSSTERSSVLIEIATVFARYSAKRVPTVLLLDWAVKGFTSTSMEPLVDFLSSDENSFQTIIERVTNEPENGPNVRLITLCGREADVVISSPSG